MGLREEEPGGGSPAGPCPLQTLGPSSEGRDCCLVLAVAAGHMLHRLAGMALPTPAEHCLEKEGLPGARLGGKVQTRGPPAAQRG